MAMTALITNIDDGIYAETRSGIRNVGVHDPTGSTIALYGSGATLNATYSYWQYGQVQSSTGSVANPWQFCGSWGYRSDTSALTYVGARELSVSTGSWLQPDLAWPFEPRYVYARGNPQTNADPTGLFSIIHPPIYCGVKGVVEVGVESSDVTSIASGLGNLPHAAIIGPSTAISQCAPYVQGRDCGTVVVNGSLFDDNSPNLPIGPVLDCTGKYYEGEVYSSEITKCTKLYMGSGYICPRNLWRNNIFQLTYIPGYGSKTQRTVVGEDASGLSFTLVPSPGMTGAAMKTCFSQGSSGTFTFNWYNLDGGSSTQAWQSPASAPTALIQGGRPAVSNWPWITQTKQNA